MKDMQKEIDSLKSKGFSIKQLKDAFSDGAWLGEAGYTQEEAEEADDLLRKS